jgi:hypothetical protein
VVPIHTNRVVTTDKATKRTEGDVKKCKVCNELKPSGEFYACKSNRDGLMGKCKGCQNEYTRDYDKPLDVRWLCKRHHGELHQINDAI